MSVGRARAAIVASGSELVRGDRHDRNGPFLAAALLGLGIEPAEIRLVGDRPDDLEGALRDGLRHDLLVVSGGLGPTHDDRTIELLAHAAGVGLRVDEELRLQIEGISRRFAERMKRPFADFEAGVRKQATIPEGGLAVDPAGTAPAVVLDTGACVAVALPGPPRELQALWPQVLATEPMRRLLSRSQPPERRVLRFFGVSESALAAALAAIGGDGDGVEVTICARDFELHVDLFVEPGATARANALESQLVAPVERYLFAREEESIEAIVLRLCRERGLTLATAESCTGGLVSARLTSVPGSSEVFLGGIVSYADAVKTEELGVPVELLRAHGAVSAEVAAAMARGVRERFGADVAVAVTGVAGPGGGTESKPVGLVHLHASAAGVELPQRFEVPGEREVVRARAGAMALHLLHRLVTELPQT